MKQRSSLMNLFWTVMAILSVGAAIFGGYVAWRLIHSTAPKVERANIDPEQLLERTLSARQEEMKNVVTENAVPDSKIDVIKDETKSSFTSLPRNDGPAFWEEEAFDDEDDETEGSEEEEGQDQNNEFSYTLEDVSTSKTSSKPATKSQASSSKSLAPKVIDASYEQGLLQCQKGHMLPCSWKDSRGPLVKQYWLRSYQGPVERVIYTHNGKVVSQTFSSVSGVVNRYQGAFAELYFENGLLTKIRTFPYDNPNLRDWFLIDKNGKISACLCGIPTKDCCSRSFLYKEGGPRRYCDLFPLDPDFCSK